MRDIIFIKITITITITNRITITTICDEVSKNCTTQLINPLQDNQVIVNLIIDYDISCVSCA